MKNQNMVQALRNYIASSANPDEMAIAIAESTGLTLNQIQQSAQISEIVLNNLKDEDPYREFEKKFHSEYE